MAGARGRRGSAWAGLLALVFTAIAAVAAHAQSPGPGDLGDLPIDPQWLANTLQRASTTTSVQNNLIPGALERRDKAIADWKAAPPSTRDPLAKPEYLVVWSAKQNGGHVSGKELGELIGDATGD